MKGKKQLGMNTICTHVGEVKDEQFKGAISPIYLSTSYATDGVEVKRYPRYMNTPNQEALCKKIAALEKAEAAMIFGSGMAAISNTILALVSKGDHIVFQKVIYGGAYNFVVKELDKYGIEYSFAAGNTREDFEKEIKANTKAIYIETPSNPLLGITDLQAIGELAKARNLLSMIDTTFASPINQNPVDFGIDVMIHSATKYMGGHSDILAGAVAASQAHIDKIFEVAINYGGSLSDFTVWLLERSLKTLNLRVQQQNKNAQVMAEYLHKHPAIDTVYYPGLPSHPEHAIAKAQMRGFGGMLSFELNSNIDAKEFQQNLSLIKPSMSLAGVESTVLNPADTSHFLMGAEKRAELGITDGLIRFSVGIEETEDLIGDIEQALALCK